MVDKTSIHVLIMAGGVGSRFWPVSTPENPKQFQDILGKGRTLIQQTFDRFKNTVDAEHIHVLTNDRYAKKVAEQLPEIPSENIICEPARRNTAPCLVYAGLRINRIDPNAVMVVTPSDHVIENTERFIANIESAISTARNTDAIVTLGIRPDRPETGYGYIEFSGEAQVDDVYPVVQFKEKPNRETAERYINSGNFYWNAGVFVWTVNRLLSESKNYMSDIYKGLNRVVEAENHEAEKLLLGNVYPTLPDVSIDYGLMERADNISIVLTDFGWSDLGTWGSVHDILPTDDNGNATIGNPALLEGVSNCIVYNTVASSSIIRGLKDSIVVVSEEGLLIYPKQDEQEIKKSLARNEKR